MPVATLYRPGRWTAQGAYAPTIDNGMDAIIGVRHYRVDTQDEAEAYAATGLPRYRDQWDTVNYPFLLVESIQSVYGFGTDNTSEGTKGTCLIKCQYRYNYDGTPLPGFGIAYEEIFGRFVQRHVAWDVRYVDDTSPSDTKALIQGGRGTTKLEGLTTHRVTVYPREGAAINIALLRDLRQAQAVNADPVDLPQIKGFSGAGRTIPAFNLQFYDFQISVERGYPKIVYTLLEGNDLRLYRWVRQNDKGNALQRVNSHLYAAMTFGNLFLP